MSLIHAGLAAGAALAALPVILHLFMRQTPKHVIFPALRLIRERQRQSKKRMRIKNWLLLLARMAILALMALALARPQIYSQIPLGDESMPMALGLVFDTSLSMEYKDKDKTRLEEAKERAKEIVAKLPDSSLVFIVDSAVPGAPIGLSPPAALKQIEGLVVRPANRLLNEAMGQVYPAVTECDRPARMVYVLTDLCRSAWSPGRPADGIDEVAKLKAKKGSNLATLVLRLAPKEIQNFAVESADPTPNVVPQGMPVEIRSRIRYQGAKPAKRMVEFELDGQKRGEKPIELRPDDRTEVSFPARLRDGELHQGAIRLSGSPDPFETDDVRYFTFRVRPPLKVLIVSDDQRFDSAFVAAALDPRPNQEGPRPILVEKVRTANLASKYNGELASFATIFLLNIKEISDADWGALSRYVHEGGGLVVAPGYSSRPESYNNPVAIQIMPAKLAEKFHTSNPQTTIAKIANVTHPLFAQYGKDFDPVLSQVPVYKYWPIKEQADGVRTLLSFGDSAPALLERTINGSKMGRVLLWTTMLSRRPDYGGAMRANPGAWNEFPVPDYGSWTFLVLMNQSVPYLAGVADEPLNYSAGENASLHLEPSAHLTNFVLNSSDPQVKPRALPTPSNQFLEIATPPALGLWTVKATAADNHTATLGFSVNPPESESQFALLERPDLDVIFGKDRYRLADDAVAHKEEEKNARFGYEIFPWLMFLILMIVTLENFLANTFYRETPEAKTAGAVS
jgi:hypothetical protein